MTIYEVLSLNKELLKTLSEFSININDYKDVQLYEDYLAMKRQGNKITYIVCTLANKYKKCERSVYRIIKHFSKHCK